MAYVAELTGAKINVFSERPLAIEMGQRGVVAVALPLNWCSDGFTEFNKGDNPLEKLGYTLDDTSLLMVREIMKRAIRVFVYNLYKGGAKAKIEVSEGIIAEAIHTGIRGNDLSVTVDKDGELFMVKTFLLTDVIDTQTVKTIADFKGNIFLKITGEGTLVPATVKLAGGTNGTKSTSAYDNFLLKLQTKEFNVIAYTGDDSGIKSKIIDYVKYQREDEDKFIQATMGDTKADYDGIISFCNGVVLRDMTTFNSDEVSAWLAGATAGAKINQSLTYDNYDNAIDVVPRFTKSEVIGKKSNGLGTFIFNNDKAKVESDINTFVSFTNKKNKDFCKNRVLRVIDGVAMDIKNIFDSNYAGKEDNNRNGRNRFKAAIVQYMVALQDLSAIEEFISDDVEVLPGVEKDQVIVNLHIKPVDSMEKAYVNIAVR